MATIQHGAEDAQDTEVFEWRFEQLVLAGYPPAEAALVAAARDVDLRFAARLIVDGCPPATAARILV
jgi:hypothetical protein